MEEQQDPVRYSVDDVRFAYRHTPEKGCSETNPL
jgi:hypothetical protein